MERPHVLTDTQMEICTVWCSLQRRGFSSRPLGGAGLVIREGSQRAQLHFRVSRSKVQTITETMNISYVTSFSFILLKIEAQGD